MGDTRISPQLYDKKIVVYDIDNTLIDVTRRYITCIKIAGLEPNRSIYKAPAWKRKKFWEIFLSEKYIHLDEPNKESIKNLRESYRMGHGVILLTGRPVYLERITKEQLKRFDIPYDMLVMRPIGNREPDQRYKPCVIEWLIQKNLKIVEYHEDDPATIRTIEKKFPQIKVYRHNIYQERLIFHRDEDED
jgi:hypothetical protein